MQRTDYARLASVVLVIHGCIEILALSMLFLPPEFIPITLSDNAVFWGLIGAMYGISRLASGYLIIKMRKNGIALGVILSTVTLVVAAQIQFFGLMDLPMSLVVLWALLSLWFGSETTGD